MEETLCFFSCYRMLIDSYRLSPETETAQLAEILRRVKEAADPAAPPVGRRGAAAMHAGGMKL